MKIMEKNQYHPQAILFLFSWRKKGTRLCKLFIVLSDSFSCKPRDSAKRRVCSFVITFLCHLCRILYLIFNSFLTMPLIVVRDGCSLSGYDVHSFFLIFLIVIDWFCTEFTKSFIASIWVSVIFLLFFLLFLLFILQRFLIPLL